ncbi:restriction endonuclease subunit S [Acinetobacter indicus]|uniref:restriction endonuclease subunit S n=1 Tax=Acinetobacter indicus TaxID=756892 RepID=UPI0013B07A12|nr:restriction endonuclease subunit S [Acinetobacter indicus]QIC78709.1 restriction endonuclease subunit S [Acinetobacter indicus]
MTQYENYKLTYSLGFEKIPEEWNLKKVKYLFNIGRGRVISQEELMDNGLYPVFSSQTQNNGCLGYINTFDFDCEQLTWTTDGANAGTVFIRSGKHNCTNVCGTLQPIKNQAHLKFSHYALQYATQFHKRPDTNGAKIMNNEMAEISFALPSQQEQFKIVEYLNYETAKIDSLIAKQEKLIELLKEKRQAVISHAVTKGLNPNVAMKDSGVEWLGQVPEHWVVAQLKFNMLDIQTGPFGSQLHAEDYIEDGIPLINPAHMVNGVLVPDSQITVDLATQERLSRHKLAVGDIIFARRGELGRCAIVREDNKGWLCGTGSLKAKLNDKLIPEYAYLLITSDGLIAELSLESKGSTMDNLNTETLGKVRTPVPPNNEQIEILNYVEQVSGKYKKLIKKAETAIQLMQERRTALISSAVTGKIDVRNWQKPNNNNEKQGL